MRTHARPLARSLAVIFGLLAVAVLSLPVLAAESGGGGGGEEEEAPTTTVKVEFEYTPAVTIPDVPPAEVEQPWTTKFLVPTGVALAAVAVFATVVQYFLRVVRTRYKVVE